MKLKHEHHHDDLRMRRRRREASLKISKLFSTRPNHSEGAVDKKEGAPVEGIEMGERSEESGVARGACLR